jgi:rhodanese-related sulfurtransferase
MSAATNDPVAQLEVDPSEVAAWLAGEGAPEVIDVREPYEREAGHIEGTRHIALVELSAAADSVERERPVVFYCRVGSRSLMAAQAFRASGYDAYSLRGGLARWVDEGHPLSPPGGYVADHQ